MIKILLIYSTLIFIYYKYKLYHFKGPFALPIFGNLYKKKAFRFIHFINDCKHKYGKIFLFWSGTRPMIVICDTFVTRNILSIDIMRSLEKILFLINFFQDFIK